MSKKHHQNNNLPDLPEEKSPYSPKKIIIYIVLILLGVLIGMYINNQQNGDSLGAAGSSGALRKKNPQFQLINPLLACSPNQEETSTFNPLKDKFSEIMSSGKNDDKITKLAVYFRDLDNGRWTGINENDQFAPASLLKVYYMIAYYKLADSDPSVLFRKIAYAGGDNLNSAEIIAPKESIAPGNSYSIDDLIHYMIVDSDNNALMLLDKDINKDFLQQVYTDLDMNLPQGSDLTTEFASVKSYSLLFRVLYNSTYLSDGMSNKALQLLSEASFKDGIVAGLPSNVIVAHKFGERSSLDGKGNATRELHDCGIIYNSKHPYLLCVMTKGNDFDKIESVIQDISRAANQEVDNNYK